MNTPTSLPFALTTAEAAGLGAGHHEQGFLDGQGFAGDGTARAGPHDVAHFQEQGAARWRRRDGGGRNRVPLKPRAWSTAIARASPITSMAVVLAVGARLKGQASFGTQDVEDDVTVAGEVDLGTPVMVMIFTEKRFARGQQIEEFLRFAGITERDDEGAVIDDAEVAVEIVHAVEGDAGRTDAGKGGGDLVADVAGFANADDDDFAAAAQGVHRQFHGAVEGAVEEGAHGLERGEFDVKDFAGTGQVTHRVSVPSTWCAGNVEGTEGHQSLEDLWGRAT